MHHKSSALITLVQNPKSHKAFHKTEDLKAQDFFFPFFNTAISSKKDASIPEPSWHTIRPVEVAVVLTSSQPYLPVQP